MDWKIVIGSMEQKPARIDTQSSDKTIYIRRNFQKLETLNEETQEKVYHWQYEELEIPKGKEDEMYILLGDLVKTQENQEKIMLALADIYEKLTEE